MFGDRCTPIEPILTRVALVGSPTTWGNTASSDNIFTIQVPDKYECIEEDVVVSGVSGRFPESNSLDEFSKNLYDGVDMVTEDGRRWTPGKKLTCLSKLIRLIIFYLT